MVLALCREAVCFLYPIFCPLPQNDLSFREIEVGNWGVCVTAVCSDQATVAAVDDSGGRTEASGVLSSSSPDSSSSSSSSPRLCPELSAPTEAIPPAPPPPPLLASFLCFIRRFWNQILICRSVRFNSCEISCRRWRVR